MNEAPAALVMESTTALCRSAIGTEALSKTSIAGPLSCSAGACRSNQQRM
jgi:hypothetical protein